MTRSRTNVVPFERPAAYWAVRARRHYRPSQLPDAARLMRKALEKSGDPGLALELAEIYTGMGCYGAAEQYLIRAAVRQGLTGDLCYILGQCALGRGEEELAELALDQCLRIEPGGMYAESAQDLLETYPWNRGWDKPHCARSTALCRRAVWMQNPDEQLKAASAAWKKGHSPDTAVLLSSLVSSREALPYLRFAVVFMPRDVRPRLLLARACQEAGRWIEARKQMRIARAMCDRLRDAEEYCAMAWAMNRPAMALKLVDQKLGIWPCSTEYLWLKYLTLRHMPDQDAQAQRVLEALLEIDPDDPGGLYARRHPDACRMVPERKTMLSLLASMVYHRPERLRPGPLNRTLHLMVMSLNGTVSAEDVYRLALPAWRRLSKAEKRACDERHDACVLLAMILYVLLLSGRYRRARELMENAAGQKRILRLLRRFFRINAADEKGT